MWSKMFTCKKSAGTCFLEPQQQSDDKFSAPSLPQKLSLSSFSDPTANTPVNASCTFCYHFPQWQAPFPLSIADGRQSQFRQSVLTCLHLSCPSPLPSDSSCSQPLQRASQCLWQLSYHFCYLAAQSSWMSPLHSSWVKGSSYSKQLQQHLAQLRNFFFDS